MAKINTDLPEYIYQSSVVPLIDKIEEVKEDSEISFNSWGGSTGAGQQFIDFLNTKENKLTANVSGYAASMGAAILPFFDNVKGSLQSDVMLHSVSGGIKSTRKHTNQFLYDALAEKIDEVKFKKITGKELKTVMLAEDDERVDVWLTGKQAGEIGLFDETYNLLDKAASLNCKLDLKELEYKLPENIAIKYGLKTEQNNNNDMEIKDVTISMLKSGNIDVYNSICAEGKKAEQTRVENIMKYAEHDMDKANEILKSGNSLTTEHVEHFMEKKFNKAKLDDLETGSEEDLKVAKTTKSEKEKTAEQKEKEAALEELDDFSGVNNVIKRKNE